MRPDGTKRQAVRPELQGPRTSLGGHTRPPRDLKRVFDAPVLKVGVERREDRRRFHWGFAFDKARRLDAGAMVRAC